MANLFHSTILIMFTLWRLPVFLMGVSAGLLAVREVEDPHHHRPLLHDVFPWSLSASTSLIKILRWLGIFFGCFYPSLRYSLTQKSIENIKQKISLFSIKLSTS